MNAVCNVMDETKIHNCIRDAEHHGSHRCYCGQGWPQEEKVIELTDPMPMTINIVTPHGLVTTQITIPIPRHVTAASLNEIDTDDLLAELRRRVEGPPDDCDYDD